MPLNYPLNKELEKKSVFTKILRNTIVFSVLIIIRYVYEQQISTLVWFMKDHVTLKTGLMMLKIQLCLTGINCMLKHIKLENDSITILLFLLYFWSNKCSFGAHKRLISKKCEKPYQPQTFERKCIDILIIKISALSIMSIHHCPARPLFSLSDYSKPLDHISLLKI